MEDGRAAGPLRHKKCLAVVKVQSYWNTVAESEPTNASVLKWKEHLPAFPEGSSKKEMEIECRRAFRLPTKGN
jgi:hypothetical protein